MVKSMSKQPVLLESKKSSKPNEDDSKGRSFSPGGTIRILFMLVLYCCLVSARVGGEALGAESKEGKAGGLVFTMDGFLVNLADPDQMRYLKTRIDFEGADKKVGEEFEKRKPQLRDTIISILSSKTFGEINDSEGKKKLREEILLKMNEILGKGKLKTIYFTEFVVQ